MKREALETIDFTEKIVFLNISRLYHTDMTDTELYEVTRRAWHVAACRQALAEVALGVAGGSVVLAYAIAGWQECIAPFEGKVEFVRAENVTEQRYVGCGAAPYMPRGARYVVRYNF